MKLNIKVIASLTIVPLLSVVSDFISNLLKNINKAKRGKMCRIGFYRRAH